jgi:hypothetical protein
VTRIAHAGQCIDNTLKGNCAIDFAAQLAALVKRKVGAREKATSNRSNEK